MGRLDLPDPVRDEDRDPGKEQHMAENHGGIGTTRDCKLVGCVNELEKDAPTRGIWANICRPCRRGETAPGVLYRESRGIGGDPSPTVTGGSLEQKAKAIVPLAKKLERKVLASKAAKAEAAASVTSFSKALEDLRDSAMALIGVVRNAD